MSFAESRSRIVDTVFVRFGEDALWSGVPDVVRIHRVRANDDIRPDMLPVVADKRFGPQAGWVRVRPSQVAEPTDGDVVTPVDGVPITLVGIPVLDRKGVWVCEVLALDRRVTVLRHVLAPDGFGDTRSTWVDVGDVPAAIRGVEGGEQLTGTQLRGNSRRIVRMLRDAAGAALTSADRLAIEGVPHGIVSIAELGRGVAIEVVAEARTS